MKRNSIQIGWAQCSITPDRPVWMIGQMYQRFSRYVHDPITATALVLDNGDQQAIFVSMDMEGIPAQAMEPLKQALMGHPQIRFESISFNVTHTHNSSNFDTDTLRSYNEYLFSTDILPEICKPADLLEYLIRTYTNEGETVLDNCMGSGSTGVACVNSGRRFIGIEKDAAYYEAAKQRIEDAAFSVQSKG